MNTTSRLLLLASVAATPVFFTGCETTQGVRNPSGVPVTEMRPDEKGFVQGTGVESQDLVSVTDKMSRSILGIPEIARAQTKPRIVLEPVVNNTRFPINKDIFLTRIRTQLNSKAAGRVSFLDREMMKTLYRAMNILESGKFVQKIKYGCELQGLPVGECRAPLGSLTDDEKAEFRAAMEPILNW